MGARIQGSISIVMMATNVQPKHVAVSICKIQLCIDCVRTYVYLKHNGDIGDILPKNSTFNCHPVSHAVCYIN